MFSCAVKAVSIASRAPRLVPCLCRRLNTTVVRTSSSSSSSDDERARGSQEAGSNPDRAGPGLTSDQKVAGSSPGQGGSELGGGRKEAGSSADRAGPGLTGDQKVAGSSPGQGGSELGGGRKEAGSSRDQPSEDREARLRRQILEASLQFVPQHGWNVDTLAAGAESLGLPDVAHGMFPRGGAELVEHFNISCNQRLVEAINQRKQQAQLDPDTKLGTSELIRFAVETRLRMLIPYLDQWPDALAAMSLPANLPHALRNFSHLMDDIWYHAGDRSSDFNWYTKRAILAAVYKSTELRLLTDASEDCEETWSFLQSRLDEAASAGRCVRQARQTANSARETAGVLITTMVNMAGIR